MCLKIKSKLIAVEWLKTRRRKAFGLVGTGWKPFENILESILSVHLRRVRGPGKEKHSLLLLEKLQ